MPQYDPRNDYRLKYPEGDDLGDVIDCANYDSIDRSQIGKLSKLNSTNSYRFISFHFRFFFCFSLTPSFTLLIPTNSQILSNL
jgi:hypothetical protein